jgi:large subunit ribosomal protein L25
MPEITTLSAEPRARAGKGAARATRRAGRVLGIIYGDNKEPVLISLEPREFSRALARRGFFATLVDVRVDGVVHRTLPRDVQYHPATDAPLHVDFMRLGSHARVTVTVPVVFTNPEMSPGIRRGGILNIVRHGIELNCPVDSIPDHLVVELNGLEIGESLHISRAAGRRSPTATLRSPPSPRPRRCVKKLRRPRQQRRPPSSPRRASSLAAACAALAVEC